MTVTAMPQTEAEGGAPKRRRGRLLIALVLVLLLIGGGAYFFLLKPSGPTKPVPGTVDPLDSIQINLAGGHYLRLGIALQLRKGATEVDGSKALDAAINLFSGQPMAQLDQGQPRNSLKTKLSNQLATLYDGDVMGVYFTEFVTQ